MTAPAQATSQQAAVVAAYGAHIATLRAQLGQFLTALWRSLGFYSDAQMTEFTAQAVPVVDGALQQAGALTTAYLAALSDLAGGPSVPFATRGGLSVADVRRGADPSQVYGRPFHLVWRQLGAGVDPEKAVEAGLKRALLTANTDVQLAKTQTAQQTLSADRRVVGYRRVLEGPRSCGLCIVASTRTYHKAELLPMHPGCDCDVAPIYDGQDHAAVLQLNADRLGDVHQAIADTFGRSNPAARHIPGAVLAGRPVNYRDVLVTHDHGELGPVLAVKGRPYTPYRGE